MCHNTDEKSSSIVVAHCDNNSKLKVRVLLDTGALQGNYISLKIARRLGGSLLREKAEYKESDKVKLVCSPINESCVNVIDSVCLILNFENKCKIKQSLIQFNVLSSLSGTLYDLIVGQSSIREHNLIGFYLDRFVDENTARGQEGSVQPAERTHTQSNSDHPNSSVVDLLVDLRGREIDNPQYVAPDNADDIDFPNESES
jgi:hypothetical protein